MIGLIEIQKLIYKTFRVRCTISDNTIIIKKYSIIIEDTENNFVIKHNNLHIFCKSDSDIIICLKKIII